MHAMIGRAADYPTSRVSPWVNDYPAGSTIPPHCHDDLQVLYANSGTMYVRTERQASVVSPGSAVVIPPGVEHEIRIHGHTKMASLYLGGVREPSLLHGFRSITVSPILKQLILRTVEKSSDRAFSASRNVNLLGLLFEEMQCPSLDAPNISIPADRRAAGICETVLADPSEPHTLEELANDVGACSRTISRIFRRELGLSFSQWRQRVRVSIAIDALHQGQPVSKIAFDLGYSNVSAFSHAFRKQTGHSPTDYCKKTPGNLL